MKLSVLALFGSLVLAVSAGAETLPTTIAWTNAYSVIGLGPNGNFSTLRELDSGRELLKNGSAMVRVTLKDGQELASEGFRAAGVNRYAWNFGASASGEVTLSVRPEKWGLVLKTESCTVKDYTKVVFGQVWPECRKYGGFFLNMLSDDESGVIERAYDINCDMILRGMVLLESAVEADVSFGGHEVAIVAAPRAALVKAMKYVTIDAKAPISKFGGAWSLGAQENRGSYLFTYPGVEDVDSWIDACRRGGFSTMHIENWQQCYGHYEPDAKRFPQGWSDVEAVTRKAKAAGLRTSFHTLTALISPRDAWIRPTPRDDLMVNYSYTLAAPLSPDAREIVVNECPGPRHDLVTSYFSNGNYLKIGNELIQYTAIRRDRPYAFSGLTRGASGSTVPTTAYPAGTKIVYLHMHFNGFFPAVGSSLLQEMSTQLGANLRKAGADFVYQDGAEPFASKDVAHIRRAFYEGVGSKDYPVQIEASCQGAHSWWFHSRVGAMDFPLWGMRQFHDRHLKAIERQRNGDLMATLTGWWCLRTGDHLARGHFIDELEYFASKNAVHDTATAIIGVKTNPTNPIPYSVARQLAVFGWYERPRMARVFNRKLLDKMSASDIEMRLRQDETGAWKLSAGKFVHHRIGDNEAKAWSAKLPNARTSAVRVEALYGASTAGQSETLVSASSASEMEVSGSKSVNAEIASVGSEHGQAFRFSAANNGSETKGEWARAKLAWPHPFRKIAGLGDRDRPVLTFWVKGDGSGAILNVQPVTPVIFVGAKSEHYVRLDFTGWRRFEMPIRERDAADFDLGGWNYFHPYDIFRNPLRLDILSEFNFYLGCIPAGGRTEVEISEVRVCAGRKVTLKDVAVSANGTPLVLPFPLVSGEFAELEDGAWTRYAENGEPLERVRSDASLALQAGENAFAFDAKTEPADAVARAEVSVLALGKSFPAWKKGPLTAEEKKGLGVEAMEPVQLAPARGFDGKGEVVCVRPGEKAELEITCYGPVNGFQILGVRFPNRLKRGERLELKDSRHWRIYGAGNRVLKEGDIRKLQPLSGGTTPLRLSTDDAQADARFEFVKRYLNQ